MNFCVVLSDQELQKQCLGKWPIFANGHKEKVENLVYQWTSQSRIFQKAFLRNIPSLIFILPLLQRVMECRSKSAFSVFFADWCFTCTQLQLYCRRYVAQPPFRDIHGMAWQLKQFQLLPQISVK